MMGPKTAASTFSYLDVPLGSLLLMTLLGTGATGYLTKKILDERYHAAHTEKYEPPKATRVVFRSQPTTPEQLPEDEKMASAEDEDVLRAALVLHMVKASGDMSIFENPDVKAAMLTDGSTPQNWMDMTKHPSMQQLFASLMSNQGFRRTVQRTWMQDHPILKHMQWALKVPGLNNIADYMTNRKMAPLLAQPKMAMFGVPTASGITNSIIGSLIAEKADDDQPAKAAPVAAQASPEEVANSVQLSAEDPKAQEFLEAKKARIRQLLMELAAQRSVTA